MMNTWRCLELRAFNKREEPFLDSLATGGVAELTWQFQVVLVFPMPRQGPGLFRCVHF